MKISTSTMLFICVLWMCCMNTLSAQGWERLFLNKNNTTIDCIRKMPDEGYLVYTRQGLLKLDANGQEQEFRMINGNIDLLAQKKAKFTTDNHLLIVGSQINTQSNDLEMAFAKLDLEGNLLWRQAISSAAISEGKSIDQFPNGSIVVAGQFIVNNIAAAAHLIKTDANGQILWDITFGDENPSAHIIDVRHVLALDDGSTIVASFHNGPPNGSLRNDQTWLRKFDTNGQLLWANSYGGTLLNEHAMALIATTDGGFAISGEAGHSSNPLQNEIFLLKTDADGNQEWLNYYPLSTINQLGSVEVATLVQAPNGGFAIGGWNHDPAPVDAFMLKTNDTGEELWRRFYRAGSVPSSRVYGILNHVNGGFVLAGNYQEQSRYLFVALTDSLGYSITNNIKGLVFHDENYDCEYDNTEKLLDNWLIKISGERDFYTKSNLLGLYQTDLDTGNYSLQLYPPSPYWQACQPTYDFRYDNFFDTLQLDVGVEAVIDCPLISLGVCTGRMRRCYQNSLFVSYRNVGTLDAQDTYIEIVFDDYMIIDSASIPITSQNGQRYRFDIGTLPYNASGRFTIYFTISCEAELGQTHCVKARAYPDSLCLPTGPWSGASIEVDGTCIGDTLEFVIRNVGTGNMAGPLPYYIVVDDVILHNEQFTLPAGGSLVISNVPAGATARLHAAQEPGHPGNSNPSIAFEGCGEPPTSQGFINQFPEDDADHFVDIFCQVNTGSYDPNDKQALPVGYGPEHYIKANQDLEYIIRFQNTGTDTAFQVVIRDTLPPELDLLSIQPNASSHNYTYELYGPGILQFTFDNIQLPDSNVNVVGSQGFVQFRIKQKPDNPIGTVINNSAAIYFDFNSPIITNTTWHTIGEDFVPNQTVSTQHLYPSNIEVQVSPNPFRSSTFFEIKGMKQATAELAIYDLKGRKLMQHSIQQPSFRLEASELSSGIYFYEVSTPQQLLARGKLIVH